MTTITGSSYSSSSKLRSVHLHKNTITYQWVALCNLLHVQRSPLSFTRRQCWSFTSQDSSLIIRKLPFRGINSTAMVVTVFRKRSALYYDWQIKFSLSQLFAKPSKYLLRMYLRHVKRVILGRGLEGPLTRRWVITSYILYGGMSSKSNDCAVHVTHENSLRLVVSERQANNVSPLLPTFYQQTIAPLAASTLELGSVPKSSN